MNNLKFNIYTVIDNKKRELSVKYFKDFCDGMFVGWIQSEYLWAKAVERYEDKFFCTYNENVEEVFKQMKYEIDILDTVVFKYARKKYDHLCGQLFATIMFFSTPIVAMVFDKYDKSIRNMAVIASKIDIESILKQYDIYIDKKDIVVFQPTMLTKKQREEYKVFLQ